MDRVAIKRTMEWHPLTQAFLFLFRSYSERESVSLEQVWSSDNKSLPTNTCVIWDRILPFPTKSTNNGFSLWSVIHGLSIIDAFNFGSKERTNARHPIFCTWFKLSKLWRTCVIILAWTTFHILSLRHCVPPQTSCPNVIYLIFNKFQGLQSYT